MEELRPVAVGITVVVDIAVVTGTVGINIAVRIGIGIQPGNTAVEVRRPTDLLYKISLNFVPKESNRFFRIIHPRAYTSFYSVRHIVDFFEKISCCSLR